MSQLLPKLRTDLESVQTTDDVGVVYFDIIDSKTKGTLRLYDFEWYLAQKLSETNNWEEFKTAAQKVLGFEPTQEELQVFCQTLSRFGLLLSPKNITTTSPTMLETSETTPKRVNHIPIGESKLNSIYRMPIETSKTSILSRVSRFFCLQTVVKIVMIPLLGLLIYLFFLLTQSI